ncbi:putative nucleotidyltransferase component of viral defense system [Winogradskyella pacifica]|uniref:Putative nucleotidyltransferase component of viral defense system n=1 Tax=Winogradskyella pacifica TaxID=664642 RepID=A0A3D9N884_9FLAO|nr:nucleotidyl transferase AbiEii/AbiGii toxin family protein [Winogradskyella pacifica]REE28005.1 putative nucleotidyltransferase component of viral defense system [Winogradskyella pacifica]
MNNYKHQVRLLLSVIPEVAKEKCFALHGGTAINLFVRNMSRLSVDIDLTYIPIENRTTSFSNINNALGEIKKRLNTIFPNLLIEHQKDKLKLQISDKGALIKIEVNQGIRGLLGDTSTLVLCNKAQEDFDVFCSIQGVSFGQLYGGKIVAALDRQHPRDLFDVKDLLDNEGFTEEIKEGFIFTLLSSKRPIKEVLFPNLINQEQAFANQFMGMTERLFSYADFEQTREKLIENIQEELTESDKKFIVNFENTSPDWSVYDFEKFPAIQWKLQNLQSLKESNLEKHTSNMKELKRLLIN